VTIYIYIPNGHEIFQAAMYINTYIPDSQKYTNSFNCEALQNVPKYGLVMQIYHLHSNPATDVHRCAYTHMHRFAARVARWYIFRPKIPIWVNFRGTRELKMLVYFMVIGHILRPFGVFYGHLVKLCRSDLVYFFPFWHNVSRKILQPWRSPFHLTNAAKMGKHWSNLASDSVL
jgi:hypothetical protein